jgi:Hemerythrin HHE cation binding domain
MNATRIDVSAPRLLDVHEQLRDDLAHLRVQADSLWRRQRTTDLLSSTAGVTNLVDNLRLFCHRYGAQIDRHQKYENRWLFPSLRATHPRLGPLLDNLLLEHDEMTSQTEQIGLTAAVLSPTNAAATADLRLQLEDVAYQLEIHLSHTEDHILHLLPTASAG